MPIYSLKSRTLRAKQTNSLNLSTVITTSPRSPSPFCLYSGTFSWAFAG
jgi:hypothetical protein